MGRQDSGPDPLRDPGTASVTSIAASSPCRLDAIIRDRQLTLYDTPSDLLITVRTGHVIDDGIFMRPGAWIATHIAPFPESISRAAASVLDRPPVAAGIQLTGLQTVL